MTIDSVKKMKDALCEKLKHISNLHLAQQSHLVALQSRLVYYAGILQNLLLETDSAQQLALLSLGSMILKVLAEVALVASLGYGVTHSRQFHLYHVLKFSHELIVAFLRHIFHNAFFLFVLFFGVQRYGEIMKKPRLCPSFTQKESRA